MFSQVIPSEEVIKVQAIVVLRAEVDMRSVWRLDLVSAVGKEMEVM